MRELLNYLVLASADADFKSDLTEKICTVAEKYAPNKRWYIDTIIKVLEHSGSYTREHVASDLIIMVSTHPALQVGMFVCVYMWCVFVYVYVRVSAHVVAHLRV